MTRVAKANLFYWAAWVAVTLAFVGIFAANERAVIGLIPPIIAWGCGQGLRFRLLGKRLRDPLWRPGPPPIRFWSRPNWRALAGGPIVTFAVVTMAKAAAAEGVGSNPSWFLYLVVGAIMLNIFYSLAAAIPDGRPYGGGSGYYP